MPPGDISKAPTIPFQTSRADVDSKAPTRSDEPSASVFISARWNTGSVSVRAICRVREPGSSRPKFPKKFDCRQACGWNDGAALSVRSPARPLPSHSFHDSIDSNRLMTGEHAHELRRTDVERHGRIEPDSRQRQFCRGKRSAGHVAIGRKPFRGTARSPAGYQAIRPHYPLSEAH